MAYCDKCGAYIPDGFSKCFACGYDAEEEAKAAAQKASAAAAQKKDAPRSGSGLGGNYYSFTNEALREKLEQQRERQKEISRKWAEAERERRQAQKEHQAESYVNRSNSYRTTDTSSDYSGKRSVSSSSSSVSSDTQRNKALAVLSYIGFLCVLPFFVCPNDRFAVYHAKQGLALVVMSIIAAVLSRIPILGWLIYGAFGVLRVICIIKGISNALSNKTEPLPLIGNLFRF